MDLKRIIHLFPLVSLLQCNLTTNVLCMNYLQPNPFNTSNLRFIHFNFRLGIVIYLCLAYSRVRLETSDKGVDSNYYSVTGLLLLAILQFFMHIVRIAVVAEWLASHRGSEAAGVCQIKRYGTLDQSTNYKGITGTCPGPIVETILNFALLFDLFFLLWPMESGIKKFNQHRLQGDHPSLLKLHSSALSFKLGCNATRLLVHSQAAGKKNRLPIIVHYSTNSSFKLQLRL